MSNVNEVVTEAMQEHGLGGYQDRAAPVIEALSERDEEIADRLIAFATDQGLSEEQARNLMIEVGLLSRPAPVAVADVPEDGASSDTNAILARIENTLSGLTAFARRHGYNG